jgi:hypothetical protein
MSMRIDEEAAYPTFAGSKSAIVLVLTASSGGDQSELSADKSPCSTKL